MEEDEVDDPLFLEPDVEGLPELRPRPLARDDLEQAVVEVQGHGASARVDRPELPCVGGAPHAVRRVARRARHERSRGFFEGQQAELVPLRADEEEVLAFPGGAHHAERGDAAVDGDVDDALRWNRG